MIAININRQLNVSGVISNSKPKTLYIYLKPSYYLISFTLPHILQTL
jgi:hypothetical protein